MSSTTVSPAAEHTHPQARRAIISSSIGNALEWFDILIYGAFAVVIAKQFFPTNNETVSLLLTFATFGVSFFMRPLGAIVLGAYADRVGRKSALMMSIVLMTIGTAMIAFMPNYETIGLLAPAGVALGKMIQGFSAGGEFGSSTAFLVEHAPHRRGFFSSWQVASQGISLLLAAIFGAVLNNMLTPEQLASWGWRVPFVFGLLIAPAGIYIRRHLDEAPEFKDSKERTDAPLRDTFASQKLRLLIGSGSVIMATVSVYLSLYIPTYAVKQLGLPAWSSFAATSVAGLIMFIGSPLVGAWSDKIGRTPFMIASSALYIVLTYPMFVFLTNSPGFVNLLLLQIVIGVLMTMYFAAMPALLADIFPVATRGTGMSLAYNIAVTIFGGFAGLIITWLIDFTGNKLSVSYFVIFGAVLSLIATIAARTVLRLR
ncbi:MFS transporter [Herbaspirillum sp. WKF16]|uniref:MFS transporter n=1 Tax=Herbaspirillum sp. WKF16 TaxID=3028312 RepID=UPI0023A9A7ED|nr:MFS transporter [Herbaspirillum sp. WKF16]WDZ97633.1 MFS transporter [Herbaspirillum sp. WKF16]